MAGRHHIDAEEYETHNGHALAFRSVTADEDYDDLLAVLVRGEEEETRLTLTSEDAGSVCSILRRIVARRGEQPEQYETHDGCTLMFEAAGGGAELVRLTVEGEAGELSLTLDADDVSVACQIIDQFVEATG